MEKHILTLDDIIRNLYLICGKKYKKKQEDLDYLLNKGPSKIEVGSFFPANDTPSKNTLSSLRTGGIKSKSNSGFPKSIYQDLIDLIIEDPKKWFQQYINLLAPGDFSHSAPG